MSRKIVKRYLISGTLVAETPLHVGSIDGNPATDMPLAVDGQGRRYLPGTSLAGPLRHWLIERFGHGPVQKFWGWIPRPNSKENGHASTVTITDVPLGSAGRSEIRDGVGIDRRLGTAHDGIKFDREILPKGTKIALKLTVDTIEMLVSGKPVVVDGTSEMRQLLDALSRGDIRLGAAKTRGLGKVKLDGGWTVRKYDMGQKAGVLSLLKSEAQTRGYHGGLDVLSKATNAPAGKPRLLVTVHWQPKAPVMIKASADGAGIDMMPLVTSNGAGQEASVITGSSSTPSASSRPRQMLSRSRSIRGLSISSRGCR